MFWIKLSAIPDVGDCGFFCEVCCSVCFSFSSFGVVCLSFGVLALLNEEKVCVNLDKSFKKDSIC